MKYLIFVAVFVAVFVPVRLVIYYFRNRGGK